jgi:hypothetical protein
MHAFCALLYHFLPLIRLMFKPPLLVVVASFFKATVLIPWQVMNPGTLLETLDSHQIKLRTEPTCLICDIPS